MRILYWYVTGYFNKKLEKRAFQKQEITEGTTAPPGPVSYTHLTLPTILRV